jgi:hypothetical protein
MALGPLLPFVTFRWRLGVALSGWLEEEDQYVQRAEISSQLFSYIARGNCRLGTDD